MHGIYRDLASRHEPPAPRSHIRMEFAGISMRFKHNEAIAGNPNFAKQRRCLADTNMDLGPRKEKKLVWESAFVDPGFVVDPSVFVISAHQIREHGDVIQTLGYSASLQGEVTDRTNSL